MDVRLLSAARIAADVSAQRTTAAEVAAACLARVAAYDTIQPETWITRVPPAQVIERACAVDARLAAGEKLPLAGVPYAVKDNIDVAGFATTAACPEFAYRPAISATVVERLEAAGAVLVGKTNLDQFATGLVGTRSPYGAPRCVFNREYVSGGSSSGSAVAVAAGLVAFALGTDTAGSGRVPAAFNGLVGLKPTRGRWSTRGVVPACQSLDCVTVLAGDAMDAGIVDRVATGFDPGDIYARREATVRTTFGSRFRVGVPKAEQLDFFGDAESAALFAAAKGPLAAAGGAVTEVDIAPLLGAALLLYGGPWVAERTAVAEQLLRSRPGAIHPVVRAILQAGGGVTAVETFRGLYALQGWARAAESIWQAVDVLLLPTAATIYRVAEVLAEPVQLNNNLGRYTNFVNLLDLCALALPAGYRRNGTGFGVSLVAPAWSDAALLDLGRRCAMTLPRPPLDLVARAPCVRLAVVGAHLSGMPLHWQLSSRGARLAARTRTDAGYRLYAMQGTTPAKPALVRAAGGAPIEVEVYELAIGDFGSFVAEVPPPLAIGTVTLEDGSEVKGFVAEPRATAGAVDITHFGSWRAYLAAG